MVLRRGTRTPHFAADDLLPAQRDAVTHSGGPLVVLGAAGTGKTRVISERFWWLVSQGCRPERIAVLVPSAARADALRGGWRARWTAGTRSCSC